MQVMEAGDVIGNDKVVGVSVWVGIMWEFMGIVLCVTETCWEQEIECGFGMCRGTEVCILSCV